MLSALDRHDITRLEQDGHRALGGVELHDAAAIHHRLEFIGSVDVPGAHALGRRCIVCLR